MKRFQQQRTALGSDCLLTLIAESEAQVDPLFIRLWEQIDAFDAQFSRFHVTSEVSRFNEQAGASVPISPAFHDFLQACIDMQTLTNGLFNPLVLPDLQRAGYVGSWPHPEEVEPTLDYRDRLQTSPPVITLHRGTASIPADTALDSGGIGKGYLLDQLSAYLHAHEVDDFWLSLGGDILYSGHDYDEQPWPLIISSALDPAPIPLDTPPLPVFSLATSGTMKRAGSSWHHIIDPRTHRPADSSVLSASVLATSATLADVLATSFVIEPSREFDVDGLLSVILQANDGTMTKQLYTTTKETIS